MADTLTNLQTRVRRRADKENDPHIADAELTQYINKSYRELWDLLIAASADHFLSSSTFTLSGTTDTQSLPADFYKLRGVDDADGYPVPRFTFQERNRKDRVMYRAMGTLLRFTPPDNCAGSYTLWYEPGPTELSSGSDTLNAAVDQYDEYIVVDAAIKCRTKARQDVTDLQAEKAALIQRIAVMAASRDNGEADRVTDVYQPTNPWTIYEG